jgi:protein-L-isoaspartate(D-aspartate) O-methyltransferase
MAPTEWPQRILNFTDWDQAERTAVERLLPVLADPGLGLAEWSYIRKHPAWRLRYRSGSPEVRQRLDDALAALVRDGLLTSWTPSLYEPEETAFGGPAGMDAAHRLFHADSLAVLHHLHRAHTGPADPLGRREIAVLTISAALRGARLDWYEQGDVWARVAEKRAGGAPPNPRLLAAVHRLMTVDISPGSRPLASGRLAALTEWLAAFHELGRTLADLNRTGQLQRGLRAVLAHHAIFHFNRLGLSGQDQHTLATLAKEAVMPTSDSTPATPTSSSRPATVPEVNNDTSATTEADRLRHRLIDRLKDDHRLRTPRVEDAMRRLPRHLFVPDASLEEAYSNGTVSIKDDPSGASISCASQPGVVATMLEQLDVRPGHKVLELGAGTGYNAGLLGLLAAGTGHVTTIDVDDDLVEGARAGLAAAGVTNVDVILGDGAVGHAANAPYDRIEATVGAHGVPHAWIDQLAPGGRLVAPLRLRGSVSRSIAFEKTDDGLRSIGSEMNTFMPLRRGIADDPRVFIDLTGDSAVTLVTNGDQTVDADSLTGVLRKPKTEVWTGVTLRGPESAEWLELWLTCVLPNGLSRMPATAQAVDEGLVTAPYPSSTATFNGGTLTYLSRRLADRKAPDGANLWEFGVIGHGPDAKHLADEVAQQVRVWDREYRGREVRFEIQSLDTPPPAQTEGRFAIDNGLNRVIVEWH